MDEDFKKARMDDLMNVRSRVDSVEATLRMASEAMELVISLNEVIDALVAMKSEAYDLATTEWTEKRLRSLDKQERD